MFLKYSEATTLVALLIINILVATESASVDPTIGSNWHVPPTSASNTPLTSAGENRDGIHSSVQNGKSSFTPTFNVITNKRANYGGSVQHQTNLGTLAAGNQHQHVQYYPEGNAYHIYPNTGSEVAEQRQEFLNPGFNGFPPALDGSGIGDVDADDNGGGSIFDNFPGVGGITSGITGTAANIAQSIGLGSLGVFGSILVLLIGAPLIVLAILLPAAVLVIAILGFPVLQLTLPPTDPNLGRMLKSGVIDAARKAKQVLQSEECVERFSCELARKSRKLPYENWILEKMDNSSISFANRVSRSVKVGRSGEDCTFKCLPVTKLRSMFETFTSPVSKQLS